MEKRIKWLLYLCVVLAITAACNLLSGLNPVDDVVSEIEDLADQVPVEEIQDEIESLVTELPGDLETLVTDLPADLDEGLDTIATDLPADLDEIEDEIDTLVTEFPDELGDLDGIGDLLDGVLGSEESPSDIPLVDDPKEILIESEGLVSYFTPQDFNFVLSFYQEQMPINGWVETSDSVINEDTALLYYEKPDREVTITLSINPADDETTVMIIIQDK
jgi:hypothetical protein